LRLTLAFQANNHFKIQNTLTLPTFGLILAGVLLPEKRNGGVIIHENDSLLFQTILRHSAYWSDKWWKPAYLARELKYRAKRLLRRRAPRFYEKLRRRLQRI